MIRTPSFSDVTAPFGRSGVRRTGTGVGPEPADGVEWPIRRCGVRQNKQAFHCTTHRALIQARQDGGG